MSAPSFSRTSPARVPGAARQSLPRAAFALALYLLLAALSACGSSISSAQTPSLLQPVAATLIADDGAPAPIPVPGARSVLLDFWSPACEPCKRTIPAVLAKRAELQQKGAAHVLVAVLDADQSAEDAKATLALWGIGERFVIDKDGAYLHKLGAKDVPAFAIVDSAGVLRWLAPDGVTISNILASIPE